MPDVKDGRHTFSNKEVSNVRRELSNFLTKYVNSGDYEVLEVRNEVVSFLKNFFKMDLKKQDIWVSKSNKGLDFGIFLYPYKLDFNVVQRKKERKE